MALLSDRGSTPLASTNNIPEYRGIFISMYGKLTIKLTKAYLVYILGTIIILLNWSFIMAHGSIKKSSSGKDKVNFEFGYDENGNRIRKNKSYSTEREAELALSRHNTRMEDGIAVRPVQIKLCEWLDYWMENIICPRTEDTTQYGYRNIINTHLKPEYQLNQWTYKSTILIYQ